MAVTRRIVWRAVAILVLALMLRGAIALGAELAAAYEPTRDQWEAAYPCGPR